MFCKLVAFTILLTTTTAMAETANDYAKANLLGAWSGNSRCVLPIIKPEKAPVIDGRIHEAEWQRGIKYAGLSRNEKGLLPGKQGFVYLMTDRKNLYIAVKTTAPDNDPGGGLHTTVRKHDEAVYNDDSVEIMLSPDCDKDTAYHLIINNNGTIFDRKHTYSTRKSEVAWNIKNSKIGTRAESGWWDLEACIPLSEIGSPKLFTKLNVARNWKGIGPTALIPTGNHLDRSKMIAAYWYYHAPTFRMNDLGFPEEGNWNVTLHSDNPTNSPLILAAMLRNYTWPVENDKVQKKMKIDKIMIKNVPAGGSADLTLTFDTISRNTHWLSTVLFDPQTKEVLFTRLLTGRKEIFVGNHPPTGTFEIKNIGSGLCWYYPGYNKAAVRVNLKPSQHAATISVTIGDKTAVIERQRNYYRGLVPVPDKPGSYPVSVTIKDIDGNMSHFANLMKLTKKTFPWENNQLGKDKIILPPFTPIKTTENNVNLLLRQHKVNGVGLWESLRSKNHELLVAPMRWELVVDGKPEPLQGMSPTFNSHDHGYSAEATTTAKSASGTTLTSKLKFEYDGFYWSRVNLTGVNGKTIDRLTLIIPLKNEETPLFHVISDTIRSNPGGKIPPGNGIVWNGTNLKRSTTASIHPQLVPHIWLGGIERGLCWFVDNSCGFKLAREHGSVRLIRQDNVLQLEIDIINRPVKLKEGHSFAYGMQATPVKPKEKNWRKLVYDASGRGIDGMQNVQCLYWGIIGFPSGWAKIPIQADYSLMRSVSAASRSGKPVDTQAQQLAYRAKHDAETLAKVGSTPKISAWNGVKHFQEVRDSFVTMNLGPNRRSSLPYKYSDPRLIFMKNEVPQYFKSEWWINNTNYFGGWRSYPVATNIDYMIYGYYQEIKNGMHGIYLDDVFIMPNTNPDTVAKIDDEGEKHSELGILSLRELVKRISVIQHQFNRYPRVLQVHMTNAQLIPSFAFATSQLAWESMFGETPLQQRYSLDTIQAECIGDKLGVDSLALGGILRKTTDWQHWEKKNIELSRSFLAMTLPHEVKVWHRLSPADIHWQTVQAIYRKMSSFGHWKDDSVFVPYWHNDPALKVDSKHVIVSSYRRPGKVLAIVANLNGATKVKLSIDRTKLGLTANAAAIDLENGDTIDLATISIPRNDFRLIELR